VDVLSKDSGLHIGMEAQLNYIINQKDNVLIVPFDAVYKNDNGDHCVIEVIDKGNNQYMLQEIVVETGIEDDMNIEITEHKITNGAVIIKQAEDYIEMVGKTLPMTQKKPANPFAMGGMM
ncbi:MAG: efflux RND transporter periplasmic adaptor subunit, partial [Oscillospiraceae bacterium]|nr:efflux RND transporter periplasmic adaptor subunit [Oscillospiraceae bacterium]